MSGTSPIEPPRRRDAGRTRLALLDAAERIFVRDGWDRATLAAIGAEAGVSRGTPAYFFGSKAGLRAAMAERIVADARAAAEPTGGHPREQARALLSGQMDLVARRPALARLALAHWSGAEGHHPTGFAALEAQLIRRLADLLDGVPGRSQAAESRGIAAALLATVWSSGLPRAPGGSVTQGPAALSDHQTVLSALIGNLFNDNTLPSDGLAAASRQENSLSASKFNRWRLPGVG